MNPSTAFGVTFADELARCGLREVVIAPGSRSTPLTMAFGSMDAARRLRVHVRVDERSAAFTALGMAKASGRPVAVLCTSGTAAANFHPAVIEASESAVPLLVLTADRPPELRGTGANQAIDQIKLYGAAVRWFCEAGVPESAPAAGPGPSGEAGPPGAADPAGITARSAERTYLGWGGAGLAGGAGGYAGQARYWRSLACQAWAHAAGAGGGLPGPVHVNLPLRDPLVPDDAGLRDGGERDGGLRDGGLRDGGLRDGGEPWPEPLPGRPDGAPWLLVTPAAVRAELELPWTERGVIVCGDLGHGEPGALDWLLELAEDAGWPVLAEPSSGARRGPNALSAYPYLLGSAEFVTAHRPDVIISAGRPGLSRPQGEFLRASASSQHVVIAQGPGRQADPQRAATDVATTVRLSGLPARSVRPAAPGRTASSAGGWLASWLAADRAVRAVLDAELDAAGMVTEPRLARDLAAALPEGALLWTGSSLPVRDLDGHMAPRSDIRVLASRGASGIDGTTSAAIGAALASGGPAFALLGDLAFVHDAAGLAIGPREPRPDLCLIVVNNDGGGIFATLEQAAYPGFERLFATPHGTALHHLSAAFGVPYHLLDHPDDIAKAIQGRGLRVVEARTDREAGARLRARLRSVAAQVLRSTATGGGRRTP